MSYKEFTNNIKTTLGDLEDSTCHTLWNLYLTFLSRFQLNEKETMMFISTIYQEAPNFNFENFSEAMYGVYDKDRFIHLNVFDVFSLDEWKQHMTKFVEKHYKDQLDPIEYTQVLSYSHRLCEEKYEMYRESLASTMIYFEQELSIYSFVENDQLYQQNIFYCVEIYNFLFDYLDHAQISFHEQELKDIIIESYERYEDPSLYQGRLNYVLGNYYPTFDTLEEIANFLIEYFKNPKINSVFKDIYFLDGYFEQYELCFFDDFENHPMVNLGKNYFMRDDSEDKQKTFTQNIMDYFMDEQQKRKDPFFLCGIMIEGSKYIQESSLQEKRLKRVS